MVNRKKSLLQKLKKKQGLEKDKKNGKGLQRYPWPKLSSAETDQDGVKKDMKVPTLVTPVNQCAVHLRTIGTKRQRKEGPKRKL